MNAGFRNISVGFTTRGLEVNRVKMSNFGELYITVKRQYFRRITKSFIFRRGGHDVY